MSRRSGTQGALLQGVSQQPDRVMLPGQVNSQVNMISDVSLGLSTRPATNEGGFLANATQDHRYTDIKIDDDDFIIGYRSGDIRIWDRDNVERTVTYTGGAAAYIGEDMQFHVVDGEVLCLNRDTEVASNPVASAAQGFNITIIHALGGQFSKTYRAFVTFSDGSEISGSYSTPDGTGSGDAAQTQSDVIMNQLRTDLEADPDLPAGTTITRISDVLHVTHPTLTMSVRVDDGEAGEVLKAFTTEIEDVGDLPRFAPNGVVVKVSSTEADAEDFYLKFQSEVDDSAEDGITGFGAGEWKESFNHEEPIDFDLTTMPHQLVPQEDGTFVFQQAPWLPRQVGDEESAPFASIVGKTVRDIEGFESRIALLSEDTVVMTRTNEPYDLFRETATLVSATDPIDISSTKRDDLRFDWFVPFDRDLFVMADPGDSQFVIRGGGITAETASMVLTTEFEITSGGTPPVGTGRTILLPFQTGEFSGVKEFYTDSDNAANAANTLTDTQDRYIEGLITGMEVSQNFNLGLLRTDADPKTVYVYKYLWDGNEVLQSAWSLWRFTDDVLHLFFDNSIVFFVGADGDGNVFTHSLDLNRPEGVHGYHEMLDRRVETVVASNAVTLNYPGARFLQGQGCANPGLEILPTEILRLGPTSTQYTFDASLAPNGATVSSGQTVPWELMPAQVFARDHQDRVHTSSDVMIEEYVVHVDNSGVFTARMESPYFDEAVDFTYEVFPLDDDALDPQRLLVRSEPVYIPWGSFAHEASLTLLGSDLRPVTILELEWVAQMYNNHRGRRV